LYDSHSCSSVAPTSCGSCTIHTTHTQHNTHTSYTHTHTQVTPGSSSSRQTDSDTPSRRGALTPAAHPTTPPPPPPPHRQPLDLAYLVAAEAQYPQLLAPRKGDHLVDLVGRQREAPAAEGGRRGKRGGDGARAREWRGKRRSKRGNWRAAVAMQWPCAVSVLAGSPHWPQCTHSHSLSVLRLPSSVLMNTFLVSKFMPPYSMISFASAAGVPVFASCNTRSAGSAKRKVDV